MRSWKLLALVVGCLLLAAPLTQVQSTDEDDVEDEYEEVDLDPSESAEVEDEEPSEKDVVILTSKNFEEIVKKAEFALVEFYAPWCGHCKKLKPEYAKAASILKEYNDKIVVGKVDATEEKELAETYEVQGYPTLKWFVNGKVSDYGGGRDVETIVRWVKKKTGPPAITIETEQELETAEKDNEVIVLGYFEKFEGKAFDEFLGAARLAEDVVYAQTSVSSVAKSAGASTDPPSVVIIKNFEGEPRQVVIFEGEITTGGLEEFVQSEKLPLVIPFVDKNQDKIFDSGIDRQILVVADKEDLSADSSVFKAVKSVAEMYKGKLIFVSVDSGSENSGPVLNFFGLDKEKLPQVVSFQLSGSKKYKMSEKVTEGNLKKWIDGILEGTVEPDYKSEDPPEADKDGDVQIVVGKTFDKLVKDAKKDVLLEVYAPWCGHCKALEPTYKKLAKRFAKIDSVVIAKMDGTANEHKDVEIQGFPTLLFFPAKDGAEAISFDSGDRTLKTLTKFIKEHAVIDYELPKKKASENETDEAESTDKTEL